MIARLHEAGAPIDITKCKFFVPGVKYLGVVIIAGVDIKMDPEKVPGIMKWATPTGVKDTLAFIGLANFYRRFVEAFGGVAFPMTNSSTKGSNLPKHERLLFDWTEDC